MCASVLLAVGSAILMSHFGMSQKWHAAACWTLVSFAIVVSMYRRYWSSWRFWTALTICLLIHLIIVWEVFAQVLDGEKKMGTMYVIPFEYLESLALLIAVALLMRTLGHRGKYIRI
jgi:hypothetical protein